MKNVAIAAIVLALFAFGLYAAQEWFGVDLGWQGVTCPIGERGIAP